MATVLTLHRGGGDPAELAKLELDAARILQELVDGGAWPPSDRLRTACSNIAGSLEMRHLMDECDAVFAQRKPLGPQPPAS